MIAIEAKVLSHWLGNFNPKVNKELLDAYLDLVEDKQEETSLRIANYQ